MPARSPAVKPFINLSSSMDLIIGFPLVESIITYPIDAMPFK
jgi:hypothetical protein